MATRPSRRVDEKPHATTFLPKARDPLTREFLNSSATSDRVALAFELQTTPDAPTISAASFNFGLVVGKVFGNRHGAVPQTKGKKSEIVVLTTPSQAAMLTALPQVSSVRVETRTPSGENYALLRGVEP